MFFWLQNLLIHIDSTNQFYWFVIEQNVLSILKFSIDCVWLGNASQSRSILICFQFFSILLFAHPVYQYIGVAWSNRLNLLIIHLSYGFFGMLFENECLCSLWWVHIFLLPKVSSNSDAYSVIKLHSRRTLHRMPLHVLWQHRILFIFSFNYFG